MSANAVNQYFKALLNTSNSGGPVLLNGLPANAHIARMLTAIGAPDNLVHVDLNPERVVKDHPEYSGPHGFRRNHYAPYAFTVWMVFSPDEAALEAWPSYIGALKSFLTSLGGNIPIVDPTTSVGSYLTHMGEQFSEQNFPPPFVSNMRAVVMRTKLSVDLWERTFASDN